VVSLAYNSTNAPPARASLALAITRFLSCNVSAAKKRKRELR
jgi:hypothetical protein